MGGTANKTDAGELADIPVLRREVKELTKARDSVAAERDQARADLDARISEIGQLKEALATAEVAIVAKDALIEQLRGELADAGTALTEAQAGVETAKTEIATLQATVNERTAERDGATQRAAALEGDLTTARARVGELEIKLAGETGKRKLAERKAKLAAQPKSETARKVGPMPPLSREDRRELIEKLNSEAFEVVFSDGALEITTLNPVVVTGDAWERHVNGVMLREPVHLEGEPGDGRDIEIGGFGLFDAAGEQVAWCAPSEKIRLPKQARMKLDRTILF